jgi:PIN domain nuclease of toxin-antitoxin system
MGGSSRLRLLLDTHIWLWSLNEPERVGKLVLQEMRDPASEVWLSPISTWEALTLNAKGRLELPVDLADWVRKATAPFREALLTHEISLASRRLRLPNQDPADRLLVATAQVVGLTLVTADSALLGLGDIATLANR